MTPEERFRRLTNPQTVDDYGLSLNEQELNTFAEGKEILAELRSLTKTNYRQSELMRMFGAKAGDTIERISYGVLSAMSLHPDEKR